MTKKHSPLQQHIADGKEYLQRRSDLYRLEAVDKLSVILGLLFTFLVLSLLLLIATGYFSVAIVSSLATCMPLWAASCIAGGVFVALAAAAYLLRRPLFINPLIRLLSGILFHTYKEKEEEENETTE